MNHKSSLLHFGKSYLFYLFSAWGVSRSLNTYSYIQTAMSS